MICEICRSEITISDARFCPFCGSCIGQTPPPGSQGWEYCEIQKTKEKWYFWEVVYFFADAIDNVWKHRAGESSRLKFFIIRTSEMEGKLRVIHNEFVKKLLSENWELLDKRGFNWWSFRFRRKTF